jgi:hypothetical protein
MPEVTDPRLLLRLNGPQGVQTRPADPRIPFQLQQERNQAAASQYAPSKAQADTAIAQANAGSAGVVAQAEAAKAQADAAKAQAELAKLREEQKKVDPKSGAYLALQTQIDRVNELYLNSIKGGAPNVLNSVIPDFLQSDKEAFDTAAQGLVNPFMAAFKVPGQGSQSDTELKQFLQANTPQQGDSDAAIEEKIRNIQTRLDAEKPPEGVGRSARPVGGQPQDQISLASDGFRDEIDPVLKGVSGRLGQMVAKGEPDVKIIDFLRKNGVDPANTNIQGVLQYRRSPDFKTWQRANPGKAYPIGSEFYTNKVPVTGMQGAVSSAVGSAPGAFALNYMQGVTGRHLDEIGTSLGGDGEVINTGTQLTAASNPTASFLGDLAGQATAQYAMTALPGLRALPNSYLGRVGEDAIYGAFAGHGEGDTLGGAAANVVGGQIGRGAGAAGGVALRGVRGSESLRYLNNAQVPLTVGQIGRGTNSTLGNSIGGLEDRAAGFPIFDAIINSARRRGDEGFNQAAFREAGGSGATGAAGVTDLGQNVSNAYNFLDSTNIPLDATFAGSQAGVRASLPNMPAFGKEVGLGLDKIDQTSMGGSLLGRDWQSALRSTRANKSSISGQPFADDARSALGDVEDNLITLAERQGPAGTVDNLLGANNLNKQYQTILGALDNGPSQARGELFSPSRLDTASRAGARNYGGRAASMQGQRPFYDLTKAGMDVMPNLTPDSGTAGRAIFYSALPSVLGGGIGAGVGAATDTGAGDGAAMGAGATLLPTLLMAGLYSKGGQKGLQKTLLGPRPKLMKDLDAAITKDPRVRAFINRRMAGMFGGATARDLMLYPELEQ